MKSIQDFNVKGKRILVRCDFNVPLSEKGDVLDDAKIKDALPTLCYLLENMAKVIIITHLGRPNGMVEDKLRLDKVKKVLEKLLGVPVVKSIDCIGSDAITKATSLKNGEILLLENVRFHKEETENNESFAKTLASLGEIYINEAFDSCHRVHASIVGIPRFLPHGAGFLLKKEVKVLSNIMQRSAFPVVAIIGGAKVQTKVRFVNSFCSFADMVIINGLMQKEIIDKKVNLEYPEKVLGPKNSFSEPDISEEDLKKVIQNILSAKTVFWNGPFGKIEDPQYTVGTRSIAEAIIESGAFSVVGGGETIEFLKKEGMMSKFSHISTAGGAMLEFLSGQSMPGLVILDCN
jgi:3-phosphoglycerate kinase